MSNPEQRMLQQNRPFATTVEGMNERIEKLCLSVCVCVCVRGTTTDVQNRLVNVRCESSKIMACFDQCVC